jgi:hypothetical protein
MDLRIAFVAFRDQLPWLPCSDPTHAAKMPAWEARRDGKFVKNSQERRGRPCTARSMSSAAIASLIGSDSETQRPQTTEARDQLAAPRSWHLAVQD